MDSPLLIEPSFIYTVPNIRRDLFVKIVPQNVTVMTSKKSTCKKAKRKLSTNIQGVPIKKICLKLIFSSADSFSKNWVRTKVNKNK